MLKTAVLIPCYNEEKTIGKVVSDFRRVLPDAGIFVYDNNSSDRTAELAAAAGAEVHREHMQGKGNVMRRMFREIDAESYIIVDGDDTYPAEAAPEMIRRVLEENADMVVGDRLSSTYYEENKRRFHNFGNNFVRGIINRLFGTEIRDIMTGYRAFSYLFVKSFPILSRNFEIETEMSIHAVEYRMHIDHVTVDYRDRPAGSVSKLNTYTDGGKVLMTIARLYRGYHPFAFYTAISLILGLLSVGFMVPVLMDYSRTGLVERFPTLIVCGFVMIAAILFFVTGVILESLLTKDRRLFEMELQQIENERRRK